jgi:protein TonB
MTYLSSDRLTNLAPWNLNNKVWYLISAVFTRESGSMARFFPLMAISAALHALLLLCDFSQPGGQVGTEADSLPVSYVSRSAEGFRPALGPAEMAEYVEPAAQGKKSSATASLPFSEVAAETKKVLDTAVHSEREPRPAGVKTESSPQTKPAAEVARQEIGRAQNETAVKPPAPRPKSRPETMTRQLQVSVPSLALPQVKESQPLPREAEAGGGVNQSSAELATGIPPDQEQTGKVQAEAASAPNSDSAAVVTSPAAPKYQAALPRYKINPKPAYPRVARLRGWEGRVLFRVEVLKTGEVGTVTMVTSSGYRSLDQAADRAVRRWRFKPARLLGTPVPSEVRVPVEFALER